MEGPNTQSDDAETPDLNTDLDDAEANEGSTGKGAEQRPPDDS